MILAVTHAGDEHAGPVLAALSRRGVEAVALDTADLPRRGRFALGYGREGRRLLLLDGRPPLDLARVTALWWRRPQLLAADPALPAEKAVFSVRQATDALLGLVASLAPAALVVNDPFRDQAAGLKLLQLAAAGPAGLRLPETLVTSDPAAAQAFLGRFAAGEVVHKAVQATPADWRRTRRVGPADLSDLDALRIAPVILQERVPGVDVRVTLVGDELFAAAIDARSSSSPDDYRGHEAECLVEPCALPAAEERSLRALVGELGISFAAADFRRRDDGAWFFLELNPAGQWLFVEERTGQPITEALAGLLARGQRPGGG
ncbi:MAG TPA: alpha-L-glutamate ligase [Anaeromyxobacter sp.]|nr:alpha-L-glutamate ligase [Anaeromyxobacter sp.]